MPYLTIPRLTLLMFLALLCLKANGQNMDKHNWKHRVILIKATDGDNHLFQKQIEILDNAPVALKDRKIVVYQILNKKYVFRDYTHASKSASGELGTRISEEILDDKNQFEVILIGLDGYVKLRKTKLLTLVELKNKIDSMPMRQAEIDGRN